MEESITPGKLIDSILRTKHRSEGDGLTEFTKSLAQQSGLSERQIARMRQDPDFPKGESIGKLIQALPELEILNTKNICHRLLLPFSNIQKEQDTLIDITNQNKGKNKITIVAGWQKPQGLINPEIAKSVVNNIDKGSCYEFIFPDLSNHPEKEHYEAKQQLKQWLRDLFLTLGLIWKKRRINKFMSEGKLEDSDLPVTDKLQKSIRFISTEFKDNSKSNRSQSSIPKNNKTQFWLLLPSTYVVLYNLDENVDSSLQFGHFLIKGTLQRQNSNVPKSSLIDTQGWLYVSEDVYELIEKEYKRQFTFWTPIELDDEELKPIRTLLEGDRSTIH